MSEYSQELCRQEGVEIHRREGEMLIVIDERKARFKNRRMRELDSRERRRFENALMLENAGEKRKIKIRYA